MKSKLEHQHLENHESTTLLGNLVENFDSKRIPISKMKRKKGMFPYYGASGIIDFVDDYILDGEYLLISEDGENLRSRQSPIAFLTNGKFWANNHVHIVKANEKSNNRFLFYVLNFLNMDGFLTGTAQPKLNQENMNLITIPNFSILEQTHIGKILYNLDSKIQNLKNQNQILEQITQAIFKSWFIDFEFLNEDGKSYKSFGGEIVYNEEYGKEIPKGWEVSNIDKEFNLVMGQSPPGKSYNQIGDGIAFFQGRTDFGHRFPSVRMFCSEPSRFAKKGDTLISVRAPVGDVNLALYDCCIGRGLSAIRHKSDSLSYTYYIMLNLKPIFDNFESEGTVFGSINKTSFEQIKILAPAKNIVSLFEKIVNPIDKKIEDNAQQIQTLSKIRDFLLPKLMSGDIRV